MANATLTRAGMINNSGSPEALLQEVFSGEVLAAYEQKTVMMDKHVVRTITNGKSATFPVIGNFTASYHVPGTELTGRTTNHNEKVIVVDGFLEAHASVAEIDELRIHYDVRSYHTAKLGEALATQTDKNLLQVGILAARAAANVTGGHGGRKIVAATAGTSVDALIAAIFSAAETLDTKNVSKDDRYIFVHPSHYYRLAQNTTLMNRDWGGSGVYAEGQVLRIAGMSLVSTANMPNTNVAGANTQVGIAARYAVDATNTVALVMHKEAIGTVKLADLKVSIEFRLETLSWLTVAYYSMGHDILRPECAVEIATA